MARFEPLPGETERAHLRPHFLSFGGHYFVAAWPALWAAMFAGIMRSTWWNGASSDAWWKVWTYLYGNDVSGYVWAVVGLLLVSVPAALLSVRWRGVAWTVLLGTIAIVGSVLLTDAGDPVRLQTALPLILAAGGLLHMVAVDIWRRSHHYRITDFRIIFQGGVIVRKERQVRYDSLTDLDISQSVLGRLLDYGTIIPVTQSGFGLGEDASDAHVSLGAGANKAGVIGGGALTVGGGRSVQTGRARTFHQLTGVGQFKEVKRLLETLAQGSALSPHLKQQVDLQQALVDKVQQMSERLDQAGR